MKATVHSYRKIKKTLIAESSSISCFPTADQEFYNNGYNTAYIFPYIIHTTNCLITDRHATQQHVFHPSKDIFLWRDMYFTNITLQGVGSARDIFRGSGFIHKEYIINPLTSIINFKHFRSFLASYSKIPTQYFYFERLLTRPTNTLNPGRNHLK